MSDCRSTRLFDAAAALISLLLATSLLAQAPPAGVRLDWSSDGCLTVTPSATPLVTSILRDAIIEPLPSAGVTPARWCAPSDANDISLIARDADRSTALVTLRVAGVNVTPFGTMLGAQSVPERPISVRDAAGRPVPSRSRVARREPMTWGSCPAHSLARSSCA